MVPDRHVEHLLIGGGIAAGACAVELRKRGAEGSILIAGREQDPPYDRPPLSKGYLRGAESRADAYLEPREWYAENGVELLTGTSVMALDVQARTAKLQSKEEISFAQALIATGSMVNILHLEGAELEGIHYLRVFGNADAIRDEATSAKRVVLVGGSFIGVECAASLTANGVECAIVMLEEVPHERTLGVEAGRFFGELLTAKGVELNGGATVEGFVGDGRVAGVRLGDGRVVEGDVVIVGAGVHPDVHLAERAGIEVDNGIVCDSRLRSSAEGIWAAGDCCSYESPIHGRRLRVEHWDLAFNHGKHVARGMLGDDAPFEEVPYFWSDLADWASLEYVGPAERWDEIIWRGDREAGEFTAWYLDGDRLAAALTVGRSDDLMAARRLLAERTDLSTAKLRLADPDDELSDL